MNSKVIGVISDGVTEWHVIGCGGSDYATLCGLDGNDPVVGQTGVVDAPPGTKIDCKECRQAWEQLRDLKLKTTDFLPPNVKCTP